MSFSESSNDSDWNISISKKKKKKKDNDDDNKKSAKSFKRRNFCEKWLTNFAPWLTRSEEDPNLPFCRACQRPLGNNGYRLHRHEKTAKHERNLEILLNEGEEAVRLYLNKGIRPIKMGTEDLERTTKFGTETPFKQTQPTPMRFKTVLERGRCESPYMYTKREYLVQPPIQHHQHLSHTKIEKDSFDMFFEAISAAVKRLPPKLASEAKSRVSQVITEFELRAICEKEALEKAQQQSVITIPTQMMNVVTVAPVITTDTNVATTNARN